MARGGLQTHGHTTRWRCLVSSARDITTTEESQKIRRPAGLTVGHYEALQTDTEVFTPPRSGAGTKPRVNPANATRHPLLSPKFQLPRLPQSILRSPGRTHQPLEARDRQAGKVVLWRRCEMQGLRWRQDLHEVLHAFHASPTCFSSSDSSTRSGMRTPASYSRAGSWHPCAVRVAVAKYSQPRGHLSTEFALPSSTCRNVRWVPAAFNLNVQASTVPAREGRNLQIPTVMTGFQNFHLYCVLLSTSKLQNPPSSPHLSATTTPQPNAFAHNMNFIIWTVV